MTTLTIPPQLITDLESFARHYQGERGCVILRLSAGRVSFTWHAGADSPDVAAVIAAYVPSQEYVVVVIASDPDQPGSQLVQWQRRAYGGAIVSSA